MRVCETTKRQGEQGRSPCPETEQLAVPAGLVDMKVPVVRLGKRVIQILPLRRCRTPLKRARPETGDRLLDFDFGAGVFELLLDRSCLVFVDAFFDRLGGAVHQILGFFQA
jgi:hypothetical protein